MQGFIRSLLALTIIVLVGIGFVTTFAESTTDSSTRIRLTVGDSVNIGVVSSTPEADWSWILTKDHTFVSAQRTRFFETRFAQTGTYALDVSIVDQVQSVSQYYAFTIEVTEDSTRSSDRTMPVQSGALRVVAQTEPIANQGTVVLPANGGFVKIDASSSEGSIQRYAMDLDSLQDSSANGNPVDDDDITSTITAKTGGPLFLYFGPASPKRSVGIAVFNNQNQSAAASFSVMTSAASTTHVPNAMSVSIQGSTVFFSPNLDPAVLQGKEVLYSWDFGDRTRSLLERPSHVYGSTNSYPVTLTVQDIRTGEVLVAATETVTIVPAPITSDPITTNASASSVPSQTSSSSSQPGTGTIDQITNPSSQDSSSTGSEGSSAVLSYLPAGIALTFGFILFVLLALLVLFFLLWRWVRNRATSKLRETLEKIETAIIQKDVTEKTVVDIAPVQVKKKDKQEDTSVIVDTEKEKTEFTSQNRTLETPTTSAGPVPSWLAKASDQSASPLQAQKAKVPTQTEAVQKSERTASVPQTSAKSTSTTSQVQPQSVVNAPLASQDAPVPPWLKAAEKATTQSTPSQNTSTASTSDKVAPAKQNTEKKVEKKTQETSQVLKKETPQAMGNNSAVVQNAHKKNSDRTESSVPSTNQRTPKESSSLFPQSLNTSSEIKESSVKNSVQDKVKINKNDGVINNAKDTLPEKIETKKSEPVKDSTALNTPSLTAALSAANQTIESSTASNLVEKEVSKQSEKVSSPTQTKSQPSSSSSDMNRIEVPQKSNEERTKQNFPILSSSNTQMVEEVSLVTDDQPVAIIQADSLLES